MSILNILVLTVVGFVLILIIRSVYIWYRIYRVVSTKYPKGMFGPTFHTAKENTK